MSSVRQLRIQMGVTQQFLAEKAGTSQATIALYESGKKSPTLSTLQRLAKSIGCEVVINYVPPLTREDWRSLAYHQEIASLLKKSFESTKARAKRNLTKMQKRQPGAKALFELWINWLALAKEDLIQKILDPGLMARDMRQVSPFSGVLTPKDRRRVLNHFRKNYIHEAD